MDQQSKASHDESDRNDDRKKRSIRDAEEARKKPRVEREKDESKRQRSESKFEKTGPGSNRVSNEGTGDGSEADDEKLDERMTFPEQLMDLLDSRVAPDALWWQPKGDSFAFIQKPFTEKVLSKLLLGRVKFESFIRKLNRWGFRRVAGQGLPPNGSAYKHPLFKKDSRDLLKNMKFGQKVDSMHAYQSSPSLAVTASPSPGHPVGVHSTLGNQALATMQEQALLQSIINNDQQQSHFPSLDYYVSHQLQLPMAPNTQALNAQAELRARLLGSGTLSQRFHMSMPFVNAVQHEQNAAALRQSQNTQQEQLLSTLAARGTSAGAGIDLTSRVLQSLSSPSVSPLISGMDLPNTGSSIGDLTRMQQQLTAPNINLPVELLLLIQQQQHQQLQQQQLQQQQQQQQRQQQVQEHQQQQQQQ